MTWTKLLLVAILLLVLSPFTRVSKSTSRGKMDLIQTCNTHHVAGGESLPYYPCLSFACPILACSRKTLHESSKVFVEHALHVAWMQIRTQA